MATSKFKGQVRDAGLFIALPHSVIDSPAFRKLTVYGRSLLIDIARQINGHNNGSLLASRAHMSPLGWKSNDTLSKAIKELVNAKLIHQTVMGHRPNKASWFALTWLGLDKHDGYDAYAARSFVRGAYKLDEPLLIKPTREALFKLWEHPRDVGRAEAM